MNNSLFDIDPYGRENQDGTALQHVDDDAIGVSLLMWLTSKKGDFIKYPEMGGVMDVAVFKNMTEESIDQLIFTIKTEIYLVFSDLLELSTINVTNNYEQRYIQIDVSYESLLSRRNRVTTVYIDSRIKSEKFVYEDVDFTGENLENFVLLNLPSMKGKILKYNIEEEAWCWGRYRLNFLVFGDEPWFSRILGLVNGGV